MGEVLRGRWFCGMYAVDVDAICFRLCWRHDACLCLRHVVRFREDLLYAKEKVGRYQVRWDVDVAYTNIKTERERNEKPTGTFGM